MAFLPEKEAADVSGRNLEAKRYFGFDFSDGGGGEEERGGGEGGGSGDERPGIKNFITSQNFKHTPLTT